MAEMAQPTPFSSVEAQSALVAKFSILPVPWARAANIADLCDIDLSPGRVSFPNSFFAGFIFINYILD
jgi:hypothetical protein